MATVKIVLREDKMNKAGEAPVYLRITKERQTTYISLELRVKPQDWDVVLCQVTGSYPNKKRVNNYLLQRKAEAMDTVLKKETKSHSSEKLKKVIKGESSESFLKYYAKHLAKLEKAAKVNTLRKARSVYNKLEAYLGKRDLLFDDLTVAFLKQYEAHLRDDLGNSINTIHSDLKIFRKLIYDAIREDLVSPERNPFLKFGLETEKTTKAHLTEEELDAIWMLPLKEGSKQWHHRNLFVFAADAGGPRISDLLQLKWGNFSGTHITFTTQKTNDIVSVKLRTRPLAILQLYRKETSKPSNFVFEFMRPGKDYSDPWVLQKGLSAANAHINKNLKIIAERAGISKHISFHSSRHTFATRALTKGMDMESVSKLLGHNSIKTTQIYAKIVNGKLDQAMDVFD
ncbi:site-specific integrase [Hymenobacter sp. M29]|uniref:Site-specific integrase n=1 Tax=Hymenobacter mellowenesis TaxID=3063995 RepID=A0ABT9AA32_9BACT|nr:site-specific integrase [Hymenobacter sp. M29]MDO7846244.1 site-specific integrase [Hymenobacter sp. M29]